ncbi:MAG: chorismate-binding protein [Acidobacteriota bacterium]|nr:MAG: chorismate-binding protein [Acidobacteriota bacterium]
MLSLKALREKAQRGNVIPMVFEMTSDTLTPVAACLRLALPRLESRGSGRAKTPHGGSFLLESVEGGDRLARYSFLGIEPYETLRIRDGQAWLERAGECRALTPEGAGPEGNPLRALGAYLSRFHAVEDPELPRFAGGAVGFVAYEAIRHLEKIPVRPPRSGEDEACLMLFRSLVAFDHVRHRLLLISNVITDRSKDLRRAHREAGDSIESMRERLLRLEDGAVTRAASGKSPVRRGRTPRIPTEGAMGRDAFCEGVRRLKRHIRAGDILQGVLSEQFSLPVRAEPFSIYRALRTVNPSPYMFYLNTGRDVVLGASPEMLVRVEGRTLETCPIAGTRPRGRTYEEDRRLERNLQASVKERAEHLMLVDLGRNDIGRVAAPGSVSVKNFMHIEYFSHVMHIVTSVQGRLRKTRSPWDAFSSCFPAGTVTGAPKIRAMEILADIEPVRRGPYAGAVVYHDFQGNLDSAITIRSLLVRPSSRSGGREAVVQAGAGVVADSRPEREWQEVLSKSGAMFEAIRLAENAI